MKVAYAGVTALRQSFGVAKSAEGFAGVDGIIGFGPIGLTNDTVSNTSYVATFMDNLYNQGVIVSHLCHGFLS